MEISAVPITKPETINFILGQSHFIKTVEDMHEALVTAVPGIKFGLAFCEASGECLIRWSGTDADMIALAQQGLVRLPSREPDASWLDLPRPTPTPGPSLSSLVIDERRSGR